MTLDLSHSSCSSSRASDRSNSRSPRCALCRFSSTRYKRSRDSVSFSACNAKVVSCFCVNGELVPWFHGLLGRAEADRVLAAPQTTIGDGASSPTSKARGSDGTFLVRFSESHPTKFTLSYVKIHTSGPHVGRREMKNCLIENLGRQGYALTDSKARTFSSILSFVQRSAGRLKYGVRMH